ncbi:hypothetical protein [Ectopseudomonas oleovorans]|uniref:Regulatory protein, LacI n=1 Tax=Ectopseudomonas oleovorans (strain CECT 5344) TaxID=1182590 RepID=W6R123_ECTO5|nr:hypothetical protein [Pseudomonas oleovorans]CDM42417.1 hypothetical protein BN5_3875 [Pseudomonas oleovorans CECT 5344]CDR93040.1 hypothetical protein PPSAL_3816 [Pseudomonas oleovorans]
MTTWLDLLSAEVKASSMQKAATRLGISRTAVSLCLSGKYGASTDRVEAKVWDVLGQVDCLALGEPISPTACRDYRERKPPLHNSVAMRHWRACQHCPNNPNCMEQRHDH